MALIKNVLALTTGLLACNALAAEKYIPSLYNFSVMYDFNPVRGHVKTLTTTVRSETENFSITLTLSPQGCIEQFERSGDGAYGNISLKRQGNNLTGTFDNSPVSYVFDNQCNLVSMTDKYGLKTFKLNNAGLIEQTMANGEKFSAYRYIAGDSFAGSEYYLNDKVATYSDVTYSDINNKPLDFKMKTVFGQEYTVYGESTCLYDDRKVPRECTAITKKVRDDKVAQENHYFSKTAVSWY
ncbi:YnfC family lipoprotein [Cronobacter turicensis]|nr:YnfC family lipoprotein [Cronobacter turicensis]